MTQPTNSYEDATPPPDNCDHPEWTLGCERCFWEMKGIAEGTVQIERERGSDAATESGAILMGWHILMVLKDTMAQLAPLTRSLDLRKGDIAAHIFNQVHQLDKYVTELVASPRRLSAAIAQAAQIAEQVQARIQQQQQEAPPPPTQPGGIVLTD